MSELALAVFVALFVTQTAIFYALLRRAKAGAVQKTNPTPRAYDDALAKRLTNLEEALSKLEQRLDGTEKTTQTSEPVVETPTEEFAQTCYEVLAILKADGPLSSSELSARLNKSREHVSRLLKSLYLRGLVVRTGKPFRYEVTDRGVALLAEKGFAKPRG